MGSLERFHDAGDGNLHMYLSGVTSWNGGRQKFFLTRFGESNTQGVFPIKSENPGKNCGNRSYFIIKRISVFSLGLVDALAVRAFDLFFSEASK